MTACLLKMYIPYQAGAGDSGPIRQDETCGLLAVVVQDREVCNVSGLHEFLKKCIEFLVAQFCKLDSHGYAPPVYVKSDGGRVANWRALMRVEYRSGRLRGL